MRLRALLKTLIPLSVGILFIYLSVRQTTAEQQQEIWFNFKKADLKFVFLSVLFGFLSHLSRAYRWLYLLKPLGYQPKFINSVLTVFVAYIANLGIPRSGEVLRASLLWNYEKVPFDKSFGTIVLERLVDLIFLALVVGIALILQFDLIYSTLFGASRLDLYTVLLFIGSGLLLFFGVKYFWKRSFSGKARIQNFVEGLRDGILSFRSMEHKWAFVAHSVFIWTMYIAMFYVIKWTVPQTFGLGLDAIIPAFVVGALAISATNGGIGVYPFGVALVLQSFGIAEAPSLSFGWIMWTAQTAMVVLAGGASFLLLPFVNTIKSSRHG